MGLFHRNESEANFAGGSKNIMESIQRDQDTNTLIYLDPRVDFNTNSVITVAPNEQVIFIKNGEFYGTLPSGRHEIKNENYPLFSRIRNMLTGGMSTFTCQVYHVTLSEQNVNWGTAVPISIQDFFLGNGIGLPTSVRGSGEFRVRFNIREDDDACKQMFMRLMGDKSTYTVEDLSMLFRAQISQAISSTVGQYLQQRSRQESINAISSQLAEIAEILTPSFKQLFADYGLDLVNFSFYNLTIDETEERKMFLNRLIASQYTGSYDKAVQQELLKDIAVHPESGSMANTMASAGVGLMAGGAFTNMVVGAFSPTANQGMGVHPNVGFGGAGRFGTSGANAQQASGACEDPEMVLLKRLKNMLDEGVISKEDYEAKKNEVLGKMK